MGAAYGRRAAGGWRKHLGADAATRPVALTAGVMIVAMVGLPAATIWLIGTLGGAGRDTDVRHIGLFVIVPLMVVTLLLLRWLGTGSALLGIGAALSLMFPAAGILWAESAKLAPVGEETLAVVAEKDAPRVRVTGSGRRRYSCWLQREEGQLIEPALQGDDCRTLSEGRSVRVVYDPAGNVAPMRKDRFERAASRWPMTVFFAVVHGGLIALGAIRGRALQRRLTNATPAPVPPVASGGGPPWRPPPPPAPPPPPYQSR